MASIGISSTNQTLPQPGVDAFGAQLTCPICAEIKYQPLTLLNCLHSACGGCLKEWFAVQRSSGAKTTCPSCRDQVRDTRHNADVASLVEIYLRQFPEKSKSQVEKDAVAAKYTHGENILGRSSGSSRSRHQSGHSNRRDMAVGPSTRVTEPGTVNQRSGDRLQAPYFNICNHCGRGMCHSTWRCCRSGYSAYRDNLFICNQCRDVHDSSHSSALINCSAIRWHENMGGIAPETFCSRCQRVTKCRYECKACDEAFCPRCWNADGEHSLPVHITQGQSHRQWLLVIVPSCEYTGGRVSQCNCVQEWVISHCDRCWKSLSVGDTSYMCKNCQEDFGATQTLCAACFSTDRNEHIRRHNFVVVKFYRDDSNMSLRGSELVADAGGCDRCGESFDGRNVLSHPHPQTHIKYPPAILDFLRTKNLKVCPIARRSIPSTLPTVMPSGISCKICESGISVGEHYIACDLCRHAFCQRCHSAGIVLHSHENRLVEWVAPALLRR